MASVDRQETPTIVNSVARSFKGWLGIDADSARAAEAPQIAVAPPVNRPNFPRKPSSRAAIIATAIVRATETTTIRIGCQPSAAIWAAVMRSPRSATPMRRTVRAVNAIPDHRPLGRKEIHGHAEQQGEQHHGCAVLLRHEGRSRRHHGACQHPGEEAAAARQRGREGDCRHEAHSDQAVGRQ